MKYVPFVNQRLAKIFAIALTFVVVSACDVHGYQKELNMSGAPSRATKVFGQTRQVCFGRFVIDVPSTATVVFGASDLIWPIYRSEVAPQHLDQQVHKKLAAIESERYLAGEEMTRGDSLFGKVLDGRAPGQKLVFGELEDVAYRIYSYFAAGGSVFVQEAQPIAKKTYYTKAIDELNNVATNLRGRRPDEVPNEAGLCIDGGFLPDENGLSHERFTLGVRLAEYPDVHFSIATTKKDRIVESDALEPRIKEAESDAARAGFGTWYSKIRVFRRGERTVANWTGFEILSRKPAQEGHEESHEFKFVSQGEPNNPLLPVLDVQLDSGVRDNQAGATRPTVTDEEAIEIWDRLIRTIRVRPVAAVKPSASQHQTAVSLGDIVTSGERCPAGGWWECADGRGKVDVSGGRVQYLRAGETVPQALLLLPANRWQKIRDVQPRVKTEIASTWKLVDRRKDQRRAPNRLLVAAIPAGASLAESELARRSDMLVRTEVERIGTNLTSGAICSVSGWWQCLESDSLDGTRWFAKGAVLPPATKNVSLTVLEKIKGMPDFVRVAATWRLVRLSDSERVATAAAASPSNSASDGDSKEDS